jgi:hypothetical protein
MTLFIKVIEDIDQATHQYLGLRALTGATTIVHSTSKFHPIYALLQGNYALPTNSMSLIQQSGTYKGSNKKRNNYNIFNTLLFSSTLDPSHISDNINTSLDKKDAKV